MNPRPPLTVAERIAHVDAILTRNRHRSIYRGADRCSHTGHGVDYHTPIDAVMQREEQAMGELAGDAEQAVAETFGLAQLPPAIARIIREASLDQFQQFHDDFLAMLFAKGPNPMEVMRRLFAYAKLKNASLLWDMGFRDLGALLGETHAALAARCQALFPTGVAPWQKPKEACEKMRRAQMNNVNRTGGEKVRRASKITKIQPATEPDTHADESTDLAA